MSTRDGVWSVARAAGLLATAAGRSELETWDLDQAAAFQRDTAVNEALWTALELLPPGTAAHPVTVGEPGVLAALKEAEQELRRFPIGAYPAGTSALVAAVCDLVGAYGCLR